MPLESSFAWIVLLIAALGCDDPVESLRADERSALTQLLGDRLDDVTIIEEGEGEPEPNTSHAVLRDGRVVELSLLRMELTTTAPLSALGALERLDVFQNQLTSLDGLAELGALKEVSARSNRIASAASLEGLEIVKLDLANNALTDLSTVPVLPRLEELHLSGNELPTLEGLPSLPSLTRLDLASCGLESLGGLSPMPALERLMVSNNRLTSLAGIEQAPSLARLFARSNELTDASALAALRELQRADLENNQLARPPRVAEGVQLELEANDFRIEDPERWVVAGIDIGPPPSPYVEQLPTPRGTTGSVERRCGSSLGDIDCRETLSRLRGFHEMVLAGASSRPGGTIDVRVGRGKIRLYLPWPTNDVWTITEATPGAPIHTSGSAVRARRSGGRYAVLIEAVDGGAEDIVVSFRSGAGD